MNLSKLLMELDKLKRTYRFSSMPPEVSESSADHSWKLSIMVFSVADEYNIKVNINRSMQLALIHDIPEYITGEFDSLLIHNGELSKEEKMKGEKRAIEYLKNEGGKFGKRIYKLFNEFEKGETRESKYVNALDKMEALTHLAVVAENRNPDWNYTITYADKDVQAFPELKPLLKDVKVKLKEVAEKSGFNCDTKYDEV